MSRNAMEETVDRTRVPEPGPLRPFHFPPASRFTLPSGVPVVSAQTEGLPVVTVSVLLRAGGLMEDPHRAGVASLTSALLESGTTTRSADQIAETLEGLGVQLSAAAGWEMAQVELTALRSQLPAALEVLADLIRNPAFPEAEVERIRDEQLAAILQRRADPRGLANEMAARYIFAPESPFSRPLGGDAPTLQGIVRGDVRAFHAGHYAAGGATAVVAGEIDPQEVERLLSGALGDWGGPAPHMIEPVVQPRTEQREVVIVDRPGSVQSEIRVGQVGVPRSTPDYFPLVVMNSILGGAFTSRLNLSLRERHGFTYGVSSGFTMRRAAGPFLVSTAVQTEVTAAALREIFREVEGIREDEVTESELRDARNYLAGIFPLRLQTTDGVAGRLAEMVLYDLPEDYFDSYRDRIVAVDRAEVLRVARQHLHPQRMVAVVVGDAATIREPLEQLGLGPVRVVQPGAEG